MIKRLKSFFTKGVQIVGKGGIAAWSFFSTLAQTRINFSREVGDRYDNGVVQSAISFFWRNLQYPQIEVQRQVQGVKGKKWESVGAHPFIQAIENGPFYDDSVLWHGTLVSWYVAGNAYWLKIRSGAGLVVGYVYIPHFQIRPMSDKYNADGTKLITYYEFTPVGGVPQEIPIEEVVHFRCGVNPRNMMYGLSPIEGALRSIFAENEADTLTAALLHNGAVPALGVSPKQGDASNEVVLTPDKAAEIKERFQTHIHGDMAGVPFIMPFAVDVVKMGFTPQELDLGGQRAIAVSRILAAMGFDPMVLGLPSASKTYSNYAEANESAHETNMLPTMMILAKQLTYQTLRADFPGAEELKVGWDVSQVRALQPDMDKLYKRNTDAFKGGILKRSEAKANIGEEYDDKDEVYITDIQANMAEMQAEREDEKEKEKADKTEKALAHAHSFRMALEDSIEEDEE